LVCADDVNILGGSVHTLTKNIETLVVVSKEIGLDLNRDKTRHMVVSRDLNAGRSQNIKSDNISFENVEQFKFWGTTEQIKIPFRKIKSRLKSGNACCQSFCAESFVFQFVL